MIAAALLFNLKMVLTAIRHDTAAAPSAHGCHVRVVSHRFVGAPGTTFAYEGERYSIPRSGVIELSNVDLSREFSDLVIMQRGYQASSQVISTANDMLQELFQMKGK